MLLMTALLFIVNRF